MTASAGEHLVIAGVGMTVVARGPLARVRAAVNREQVIEPGAQPTGSGVASRAVSRKPRSHVVGIGGRIVLLLVARITVGRCAGVASADVATGALRCSMLARERESGRIVVERRRLPSGRGVTDFALLRKAGRRMIGIGRAVVIGEMTRDASRTQAGILAAHMAA